MSTTKPCSATWTEAISRLLTDGDALLPGDSYNLSSDNKGDPFVFTSSWRKSGTVRATGAGCEKLPAVRPVEAGGRHAYFPSRAPYRLPVAGRYLPVPEVNLF